MTQETILQLRKLSTFREFKKDEYICHEGEPGNEMYIILKGSVGIYLTNFFGNLTQAATITEGDFFGEMAIFDDQPRSASCIALEDAMCVAINKGNLREFFVTCPDLAERVVANMSGRIRHLDDELYKNTYIVKSRRASKFIIPSAYAFSHTAQEPYQHPATCSEAEQKCPLCGRKFTVKNFRKHMMEVRERYPDGRVEYVGGEPLWHEVYSCPHCHYSNHHLTFFQITDAKRELVKATLEREQLPVLESCGKTAPFDLLVRQYLQAIHLNEVIDRGNYALIGKLWLSLYWLNRDAGDERFAKYCARRAVKKFRALMDAEQISDPQERHITALALASLLTYLEVDREDALEYCAIAQESADPRIKSQAQLLMDKA